MATRHWRLYELDGYVGEYDYCSLRGEDIEHNLYAHESTYEILTIPRKTVDKIINMIFDEFTKVFDMEKFPKADNGPYAQLLTRRCQMVCVAIQKRICAARYSIKTVLDRVVISIPSTMEKLRDIETNMRDYVALDEHARCLLQGSREDNWVHEFIQNNFKAGAAAFSMQAQLHLWECTR